MHAIKYHVVCWETYFEIIHWHSDHSSKWYHSNVSLQRKKRRYYTEVSLAPEIGFISHQEADWAKLLLGLFLLLVTCVGGKSKQNFSLKLQIFFIHFPPVWSKATFLYSSQVESVGHLNSLTFFTSILLSCSLFVSLCCSWTLIVECCSVDLSTKPYTMNALNNIQEHSNGKNIWTEWCSWEYSLCNIPSLSNDPSISHTFFFFHAQVWGWLKWFNKREREREHTQTHSLMLALTQTISINE